MPATSQPDTGCDRLIVKIAQVPRPHLTEPANKAANSRKLAWSLCALLFAVSLMAAVGTIVLTFTWVRAHGTPPPAWLYTITVASEWGLALSTLGILILAGLSIL